MYKYVLNFSVYIAYLLPVLFLGWLVWSDLSQIDQLKKSREEVAHLQAELAHMRGSR